MQINRDLYRNKLLNEIGNILSESHGLTHKSFDGCESEKHLAAGCEMDASAGQGVSFIFYLFCRRACRRRRRCLHRESGVWCRLFRVN